MSIKGDLKSMPLTDIFQWLDMNKKTGVFVVSRETTQKAFCFKDGKVIFVSSNKEGERLGEFLTKNTQIEEQKLMKALLKSKEEGTPFTHYLIENKIVPKEFLIVTINQLAEIIFCDLLNWEDGEFEFSDGLPDIVVNSPVLINAGYLVFESLRKHDEKMMRTGKDSKET